MKNTISKNQLSIIVAISFTLTKIYVMPAKLSYWAGSSLWVCALINIVLDYFLLLLVLDFIKKSGNKSLFDVNSQLFSKNFARVISLIFAVFFIVKAFVPIVEQKNSIELTFYETQPTLLTFMPFFVVAFYILLKGYRAFARGFEISLWVYVFAMTSIMLLSIFAGKYIALLPLWTGSSKIINGSFKSLIWFGDPIYVLFFAGYISNAKTGLAKIKKAYVVSAITTLLVLIVFYAVFENIAPRQYFATLKMSKYSIALSNIGRFDYVSAFMLAAMCVLVVCLPLLFATTCLNECFSFKNKFIAPSIVIAFEVAFSIITQNEFLTTIQFMSNYVTWFFIAVNYIVPLIIYILYKRRVKNGLQTC